MSRFLVLADDRTGALETAGGLTAWWGPVSVTVSPAGRSDDAGGRAVLDLGSRHLDPYRAALVVRAALTRGDAPPDRVLLKMDSTLRGNWASDAVAVHSVTGRPAVVVPAFPAAGRTCHRGIVLVAGRPVTDGPTGRDARSPLRTSRPAELLHAAGAAVVVELADPAELEYWLVNRPTGFAVCDAVDDPTLDALGARWAATDGADFVGTAASIAAAVGAGKPPTSAGPRPPIGFPALVVVGSMHPTARAQVDRLSAAGWIIELVDPAAVDPGAFERRIDTERLVLVLPEMAAGGQGSAEPARVLARVAKAALTAARWTTLVLVGGDTTAAVLGDTVIRVEGLLGPGIAWARAGSGSGPLVITKPGGFGAPDTIAELFGRPGDPS